MMWTSEWIAIGYFTYLAIVCWVRPVALSRRIALVLASLACIVAIRSIALQSPFIVRAWAPLAYILIGYYLSAYLFVAPSHALESWLMAWDRRLLGDPSTYFARWPRPVLALLEIIYVGCFLVIVGGYAVLVLNGHASQADRYWTFVTAAELGSFAPLAFIQTRPPWAIERKPVLADRIVHDLATEMTQRFTIRVNTFPSGHVAGSLAVAIAVARAMPWAGAILLALAVGIAVGTVAGRYHYIVDAVAGAALTLGLWVVIAALSPWG